MLILLHSCFLLLLFCCVCVVFFFLQSDNVDHNAKWMEYWHFTLSK